VLLLQEEERKQKELEDERQGHVDEIAGLRTKLNLATRDFSAVEAKLKEQLARRTHQHDKLTLAHDKLVTEHAELGRKYEDETTDLRARLAELQKIVHQLKGQPYKLLDRLQKSEDMLRASNDDTERVQQEVRLLNEQTAELSRHLEDAVKKGNGYKDQMEALQKTIPPLEREIVSLRTKLDYERRDKAQLEGQVFELSQSVTQLVQRQAVVEEKAIAKDKELARALRAREQECMQLEQQLAGRERLLGKHEQAIKVLQEGLVEAQAEADALRVEVKGAAKDVALAYRLDVQRQARRRLLELHVHCVASLTFAEPQCEAVLQAVGQLALVDLSGGGLSDDDLRFVLDVLQRCPMVRELDLGSNAITDQGSHALAEFLRAPSCTIERLGLTGNQLTAQGIRRMAVALEGNRARGVRSVVLRKEGMVEAFGPAPPRRSVSHARASRTSLNESSATERRTSDCPTEAAASSVPAVSEAEGVAGAGAGAGTGEAEEQGESEPSVPIIVIDARDNLLGPRRVDDAPSAAAQSPARQQPSGRGADKAGPTTRNNPGPSSASIAKQIQDQRQFRNKVTAEVYTGRQRPNREK
jgi:predicted  nucleic acid-binding Zn-ribbon protein